MIIIFVVMIIDAASKMTMNAAIVIENCAIIILVLIIFSLN